MIFFLKPLLRLTDVTAFDLDDSKSRPRQLSVGFRYVPSPDKPHTERMESAATFHFPLVASILLSDRNRADLDWSKNQFTWRYRNRLTLERRVKIGSYHPAPYPYLSDRQWGTVREDYSPHGTAWDFFPHDHARSRTYRCGDDGIMGIFDRRQLIRL